MKLKSTQAARICTYLKDIGNYCSFSSSPKKWDSAQQPQLSKNQYIQKDEHSG
jgi:hypothetical protein